MRPGRLGWGAALLLGAMMAGCAGRPPSNAILAAARELDETEARPLMEPPAVGRLWADLNGDGALDPDEWLRWEWGSVLRRGDRDLSGTMSEPEWLAAKCEFRLSQTQACPDFHHRQFRRLDRNRDGQLNRLEWSVVSMSWFRQNDHNRDCRITPPAGEARGVAGPTWPCRPRPSR